MRVTVRDLMTLSPVTVATTATIGETIALVLESAISEVYVCDDDGRLLGAVTDYSLLKAQLAQTNPTDCVQGIMSRSFLMLHPDTLFETVAGHFRESSQSRVAVVEHGRVIGQLGRANVLRALLLLDEIRRSPTPRHHFEAAEKSRQQKPAYLNGDNPTPRAVLAE